MVIALLVLSGIARALHDLANVNAFPSTWGAWWNARSSHKHKHEWGDKIAKPGTLWHRVVSYLLRNTLVLVTDAWHFFQAVYKYSLILALLMPFANSWKDLLISAIFVGIITDSVFQAVWTLVKDMKILEPKNKDDGISK